MYTPLNYHPPAIPLQRFNVPLLIDGEVKVSRPLFIYEMRTLLTSRLSKIANICYCKLFVIGPLHGCFTGNFLTFSRAVRFHNNRSSHTEVFCKKGVLKQKSLLYVNFTKFLRTSFFHSTPSMAAFGHVYWGNPLWKNSFFKQCILTTLLQCFVPLNSSSLTKITKVQK